VVTTSVSGAWLAVKCLGVMIGNYPNEFTLAKEIKYGRYDSIPNIFYVYLGVTLLLSFGGMFYQYILYKEKKEIDELEENDVYKNA
jgi:cytochrome bd-type quinol oxidase subunit 2